VSVFKKAKVFVDKKGVEHKIFKVQVSPSNKYQMITMNNRQMLGRTAEFKVNGEPFMPEWIRNSIPQKNGKPLPCLAEQWKRAFQIKLKKGKA
tara:strand:- start:7273 stop:7551 length:279 start_codon:yes stop_codon:yes gene_type:complete